MLRACRAVRAHALLVVNTTSSGFLMAAGDSIQQTIDARRQPDHRYNWARTGRMFVVGLVQGGPQHWFYQQLDRYLPGTAIRTIAKKIVVDQLIASPFCIVLFFTGMSLMEGKSANDCRAELADKFSTVYFTDWCVWPPTQFVNFYYLPNQYRVIYVNGMTMVYNIFLSYVKHNTVTNGK